MTSSMVMTFLEAIPETQSMKEIIDKLGLIKIKKFCSIEDNLKASQSGNICKRRI